MNSKMRISIYGAGFQGRIVFDILSQKPEYEVVCFRDDNPPCSILMGIPVVEDGRDFKAEYTICAIGNDTIKKIEAKERIYSKNKVPVIQAIDQSANISPQAQLGRGVICHPHTVVMTGTIVGDHSIISTGATIDHDNFLEEVVNICPGVHTAGCVTIGRGAFIGSGAIVLPQVRIGEYALVGSGAVVTKDVPPYSVVFGVPAKVVRSRSNDE